MSFAEFMSLIHFEKLHFCRSDKFEDVFEGKAPELFFTGWPKDAKEFYIRLHGLEKERTFISCWCFEDNESYAMWQIYAPKDGIAVLSTVKSLRDSLKCSVQQFDIQKVEYMDFKSRENGEFALTGEQKALLEKNFYACKSREYEYEKELRVIYKSKSLDENENIRVDIDTLIHKVYINPFSQSWFIELLDGIMRRYGLKDKLVLQSNIEVRK